jgi:5,10-methylenetetrahydrofolate reductase
VHRRFDGWFETYAAMAIGNMVLTSGDQTPEAQVAARKRQAIDFINTLPDTFMPVTSRTALSAFVTALPSPRGTAQLQLSADPTLSAARMARIAATPRGANITQLVETSLEGATALFTWTPAGASR